jgi:hypothetical protein
VSSGLSAVRRSTAQNDVEKPARSRAPGRRVYEGSGGEKSTKATAYFPPPKPLKKSRRRQAERRTIKLDNPKAVLGRFPLR